jgi:TIR domain
MIGSLPRKCFVSHSYKDAEICKRLLAKLPEDIEPFHFPPITVRPEELVSNDLISAILNCDGLIYLDGGNSARSFWATFERDYAIRTGKLVFTADPVTLTVRPHTSAALDLPVFADHTHRDYDRIRRILDFMRHERFFDLWVDEQDLRSGSLWQEEISRALAERLAKGGYAVAFWSKDAATSEYMEAELRRASDRLDNLNDKVLFALLDETPLPEWWLRFHEPAVQLYGDSQRSETNRIDDLIVRLYWLIYRNTQKNRLV